MSRKWSNMTEEEKKAYYAARKARRAANAKAKPEQAKAKATDKTCAKKRKVCTCAKNALTPEERLLKAIGVEKPQYCDNEISFGYAISGFRKLLRLQSNNVAEECKKIIESVSNVMKMFDHRVKGVDIIYHEVTEEVIKSDKKAAKTDKKAKK